MWIADGAHFCPCAAILKTLEHNNKVRHLRVSNRNDLVPEAPPTSDYTHVGLNLFLNPSSKDGYEIGYRGLRSMWYEWSFDPYTRHTLPDHWERINKIRQKLKDSKLELNGVYQDKMKLEDK